MLWLVPQTQIIRKCTVVCFMHIKNDRHEANERANYKKKKFAEKSFEALPVSSVRDMLVNVPSSSSSSASVAWVSFPSSSIVSFLFKTHRLIYDCLNSSLSLSPCLLALPPHTPAAWIIDIVTLTCPAWLVARVTELSWEWVTMTTSGPQHWDRQPIRRTIWGQSLSPSLFMWKGAIKTTQTGAEEHTYSQCVLLIWAWKYTQMFHPFCFICYFSSSQNIP